jgi:hypothetical protein
MKEPITLETFQGHLVRYCKGAYANSKTTSREKAQVDFFEGLKMIWAIRCGYQYEQNDSDRVFEYIADEMFEIISRCKRLDSVEKFRHFMDVLHKELYDQAFYKPKDMSPIRAMIWEYRMIICQLQIFERPEGKKRHVPIVKLPKAMRQTFSRILNGNGRYDDYRKISENHKSELNGLVENN